jgi:hypothetical protein
MIAGIGERRVHHKGSLEKHFQQSLECRTSGAKVRQTISNALLSTVSL